MPVTLRDELPPGLTFVSPDAAEELSCTELDGVVSCAVDRLAVGDSTAFELDTTTSVAGSMINSVQVEAHGIGDAEALTDTAIASVVERAPEPDGGPLAFTGRTSWDLVEVALPLIAMCAGFWFVGRRPEYDDGLHDG